MRVIWVMMMVAVIGVGCRRSTTGPGRGSGGGGDTTYYDPRNISRTDSTQSSGPTIAIGPDGTIYVTWMDGSRTGYEPFQIYFRYKPPGGDWSDIEILSDSLHNAWSPHIVADPSGNVHLVWEAHTVGHNDEKIYYRMRTPTGEWTRTIVLSGDEHADQPRIAVDSSGVVHVIWSEGLRMRYKKKTLNGSWSTTEISPYYIINPYLAVDRDGGLHVVWEGDHDLYYIYRSPSGEWSEVNVTHSNYKSWYGYIFLDEEDHPWIFWTEQDYRAGWNTGIIYYSRRIDGTWTEPDSIPGTRAGHSWPRNKRLFFYRGRKYLLWGDGFYDIFLGRTDGELEDGLTNVTKPFAPPNSPYPEAILDRDGVLHVVWAADRGDGNWDIFYDTIDLN